MQRTNAYVMLAMIMKMAKGSQTNGIPGDGATTTTMDRVVVVLAANMTAMMTILMVQVKKEAKWVLTIKQNMRKTTSQTASTSRGCVRPATVAIVGGHR